MDVVQGIRYNHKEGEPSACPAVNPVCSRKTLPEKSLLLHGDKIYNLTSGTAVQEERCVGGE